MGHTRCPSQGLAVLGAAGMFGSCPLVALFVDVFRGFVLHTLAAVPFAAGSFRGCCVVGRGVGSALLLVAAASCSALAWQLWWGAVAAGLLVAVVAPLSVGRLSVVRGNGSVVWCPGLQ